MPQNRIQALRNERGLTGQQLGAKMGVDQSTISRWEAGAVTIPDRTKQQLAEFFGVPVAYLMGWSDDDPSGGGERQAA